MTIQTLGLKLLEQRGERGIREVAREIGISHATLSRVERGFLPDLDTFSKVCRWLDVDPGEILKVRARGGSAETPSAAVHFKKDSTVSLGTAQALARLILAAQRAVLASHDRN
ncbi:MAG: transcriptional regulator [Deltaproteobacteria bacterium]|nr:MAG: transcriptional regulator [Deltaproteobacteria bacterium]